MEFLNFSELNHSLLEIHFELMRVHNDSSDRVKELHLFATSLMTVYSESLWTGQIAKIFTKIWRWFPGYPRPCSSEEALNFIFSTVFENAVYSVYQYRRYRMMNTIRLMNESLSLSQEKILQQRERYLLDLQEELSTFNKAQINRLFEEYKENLTLSQSDRLAIRQTVFHFLEAIPKIWRFYISRKEGAEERALMYLPILRFLEQDSYFYHRPLYKALIYEGRWAVLEGILQQPNPFTEIAKLRHPHLLKEKEKTHLKKWIEKVNAEQEKIPSKLFLSMIIEMARLLKIQGTPSPLFYLAFWLKNEKCVFIKKNDPHQLRRRARINMGKEIQCNQSTYTLGKFLGKTKTYQDKYHYYSLENTEYIVEIANNGFRSLLRGYKEKNYAFHWGTKLIKVIDVDLKGRCVILENLPFALDEHRWTSKQPHLNALDRELSFIIANYFHFRIFWNRYSHLSPKNLRRDIKGALKTIYPTKMHPINYTRLEWDCLVFCKGNIHVLFYLMTVSKMINYPIARYYQEEVEKIFSTGRLDTRIDPVPRDFDQFFYQIHVDALRKHAFEIFEECVKRVVHVHNYQIDEKCSYLRKEVGKRLIEAYRAWPAPGFLPPHLVLQTVNSFSKEEISDPFNKSTENYAQRLFEYYPKWPEKNFIKKNAVRQIIEEFNDLEQKTIPQKSHSLEMSYYMNEAELLKKINQEMGQAKKLKSKNKLKTT